MRLLRSYGVELALTAALVLAVLFFGYLGYGLLRPQVVSEPFSGDRALAHVKKQLSFGPRVTGTAGSAKMGDWLIEQLRLLGWDVIIQPFSVRDTVGGRNIVAVRSPKLAGAPVTLLATHYDTRLVADADASPANRQTPPPGANVGASGAAVLLELARALDVEAGGQTVCLVFLDAQENGGLPGWEADLGASVFVDNLNANLPRCAAPKQIVYLDAVGAADQHFFPADSADQKLTERLWQTAANLKLDTWFPKSPRRQPGAGVDALRKLGAPTATLVGGDYPYRNTGQDTLDKISADTLQRVGLTLATWLEAKR